MLVCSANTRVDGCSRRTSPRRDAACIGNEINSEYLHFIATECYTAPVRRIWSSVWTALRNMPLPILPLSQTPHCTCACVNFTARPTRLSPQPPLKSIWSAIIQARPATVFITIYCKFNGIYWSVADMASAVRLHVRRAAGEGCGHCQRTHTTRADDPPCAVELKVEHEIEIIRYTTFNDCS